MPERFDLVTDCARGKDDGKKRGAGCESLSDTSNCGVPNLLEQD